MRDFLASIKELKALNKLIVMLPLLCIGCTASTKVQAELTSKFSDIKYVGQLKFPANQTGLPPGSSGLSGASFSAYEFKYNGRNCLLLWSYRETAMDCMEEAPE